MLVSPYNSIHVSPAYPRERVEKKEAQINLMRAISGNNSIATERAIQEGADPNNPYPPFYETPLEHAILIRAKPEIIELLVKNDADVDKPISQHINENGITPLMFAAQRSHTAVIRTLITANADPAAKDKNGKTVWDYLESQEGREILTHTIKSHKEKIREKEKERAVQRLGRIIRGIKKYTEDEINEAENTIRALEASSNDNKKPVTPHPQQSLKNEATITRSTPSRKIYRGMEFVG